MHWQHQRQQFRDLLDSKTCVYPGSVYDPISARIAADLGFEVGMFAGSIASLTVLGDPDHILLSLSELAQQAYRICRASQLPILIDADHGYGNALNVRRTVTELETAGVAALSIEDTMLPTPFRSGGKPHLISIEEGIGKMRAAVAGRSDPALVIAARTSALTVQGIEDTIARIRAYQQTGVDAIFLIGVKHRQQLEAIASECTLPLFLGGAGTEIMDKTYLASQGVSICLQGHLPMMAAIQATYDTLKALRDGTSPDAIKPAIDQTLIRQVSKTDEYKQLIQRFLQ